MTCRPRLPVGNRDTLSRLRERGRRRDIVLIVVKLKMTPCTIGGDRDWNPLSGTSRDFEKKDLRNVTLSSFLKGTSTPPQGTFPAALRSRQKEARRFRKRTNHDQTIRGRSLLEKPFRRSIVHFRVGNVGEKGPRRQFHWKMHRGRRSARFKDTSLLEKT